MNKLAVLISDGGTGSNMQAIIDAIENKILKAEIVIVVSDTPDAFGLQRASKHKIPTLIVSKKDNLTELLYSKYGVDYIVLAGWKMIVPAHMIDTFENRILNLHPGFIPDTIDGVVSCPDGSGGEWNRGKFTEKALQHFLDKNDSYAGSTVHFLSHEFDFGPILKRCFVKIESDDTVKSLYDRLKNEEHKIYIESLISLCNE